MARTAEDYRQDGVRALARARQMKAEDELSFLSAQVAIARLKWHFYVAMKGTK